MNYYTAGLGSILLPEDQEKRIDAMRKDTLDRVDAAAGKISSAVLVTGAITVLSTGALLKSAWQLRRAR